MDGCIFCKIVKGEVPSERVLENEDFVVIKDANPKVDGHSLVITKEHYGDFAGMPRDLFEGFLETARVAAVKLGAESFNLVLNNGKAAGQVVSHVHLHVLPREEGSGPVEGNHLTLG